MAVKQQGIPKLSKGFNLPFSGDALLKEYSFISLKNGAQTITAAKNDFGGGNGGATSLSAAGVKLFNAGAPNPNATTSFRQNGTQFFSTPTADTSQTVSVATKGGAGTLQLKQNASSTNQTLTNRLYNLTTAQGLMIGGAVVVGILIFVYLRK